MSSVGEGSRPLVSVVIPTYNRRESLLEAVQSALGQTYNHLEILVVDDGSTDGTRDLMAQRYRDNPAIRYLWQPNLERAAARNAGIRAARGEYIAFLDSDDRWSPRKTEMQVQRLDALPEVDVVACGLQFVDERGVAAEPFVRERVQGITCGDVFASLLYQNVLGTPSSVMVRRNALDGSGLFDTNPVLTSIEDWELWLRLAYKARVEFIPEPLTLYRIRGNAVRGYTDLDPRRFAALVRSIDRYVDRCDKVIVRRQAERRFGDLLTEERCRRRSVEMWRVWLWATVTLGPVCGTKLGYWQWLGRRSAGGASV